MTGLDDPVAIACAESGAVACLDRGGRRLHFDGEHELDAPARALAFAGDGIALLYDGSVGRFGADRTLPVPPDARVVAFTMGGGLLVGCANALHRLGDHPLSFDLPAGFDLRAIAVDPSGYWLGGASAIAGYRPAPIGLELRREFAVDAPVRSLAYGPDGAIYALLDDGRVLRDGAPCGEIEAVGLARSGPRLLALGSRSVDDVTRFVAPPPEKGPEFELPACDA